MGFKAYFAYSAQRKQVPSSSKSKWKNEPLYLKDLAQPNKPKRLMGISKNEGFEEFWPFFKAPKMRFFEVQFTWIWGQKMGYFCAFTL